MTDIEKLAWPRFVDQLAQVPIRRVQEAERALEPLLRRASNLGFEIIE